MKLLCPIELAFPRQRTDRAEIRRSLEHSPGYQRTRSHEDGQSRQEDPDRRTRS